MNGSVAALKKIFPWLLAAVFIVFCLQGASKLEYSADTRVFLSDALPEYLLLQDFEEEFGRRTTFYYSVKLLDSVSASSPPWGLLQGLETRIWGVDYVRSVVSAASAQHFYQTEDGLAVDVLPDLVSLTTLESALSKNSINGTLVTRDRSTWSVIVELDVPVGLPGEIARLNSELTNIARDVDLQHDSVEINYTGEIALMAEFASSAERDNVLLIPLALFSMIVVLAMSIKSLRLLFTLLVLLLSSVVAALALQGWFGTPVNSATAAIPLIMIVVVSANAMHLFWAILYRDGARNRSSEDILMTVKRDYSKPIAISGLTTAAGFWLLTSASSPPFSEMGWIIGISLIFSTLAILYWVPWAISSFSKDKLGSSSARVSRAAAYMFLFGRERSVFSITVLVCVVSLFGLTGLKVSDDFSSYFPRDSLFGKGVVALEETFGGPDYLEIVQRKSHVDSNELSQYQIQQVNLLAYWLREQPEVRSVVALSDTLSELSDVVGYEADASLEELLLIYEMGMPAGRDLSMQISQDRTSIRTTAMLAGVDSADILDLKSRIRMLRESGYLADDLDYVVTGISVPTSLMALTNTVDVLGSVVLATIGVALLLWWVYSSIKVAMIVLLAMLLPIGIGFGIWGWCFQEIGLATASILAATIGIVVDDVVHVVHRFVHSWKSGKTNSVSTLIRVMKEVAPPIAMSSIAIMIGFGLLSISNFGVNRTLGLSVSLIVLCALCVVFFLLPRLILFSFRFSR